MKKQPSLRERKQQREKRKAGGILLLWGILLACFFVVLSQFLTTDLYNKVKYQTCYASLKNISPVLMRQSRLEANATASTSYQTLTESSLEYEAILAKEASEENQSATEAAALDENQKLSESGKTSVSLDKLKDFDYLIQNYFTVDKTTTITSSQLNVESLLAKDCRLTHDASTPQILIYHTHSQEGYKDSVAGDSSTTVVGVGDYLTQLLTETYGYSVIHHTGTYDLEDRNDAYTLAGDALEKILAENPSIEVVIDLHRDGVAETTHLATEVNGKPTAKIMFFNGLSRTTAVGDIDYLYNPYIQDNLAFSMQLQLESVEKYPGLSRKIYLKGYRYNLHYRPNSLLIEVGAQTNTVEEAKNAMEPFAAILDEVLSGE
ncbi:MAG: stage II sporulation protein P [Eubacterium sp.]|nr:stage II sporulation protein P [Eubacterium sp.]